MDNVRRVGKVKKRALVLSFAMLFSGPIVAVASFAAAGPTETKTVAFSVVEGPPSCTDSSFTFSLSEPSAVADPSPGAFWTSGFIDFTKQTGYSCSSGSTVDATNYTIQSGTWTNGIESFSGMNTDIGCNGIFQTGIGYQAGGGTSVTCDTVTSFVQVSTTVPSDMGIGTSISSLIEVTAVL